MVVDDEPRYLQLIFAKLIASECQVTHADNGETAHNHVSDYLPDLILFDLLMAKLNGFTVCEQVQAFSKTPNIFLTAKEDEDSHIRGLNLEADDYIVKPFSAEELVARVRAVLHRVGDASNTRFSQFFTHGDLKIYYAQVEAWVGNQPANLSATEYKLLFQFAQHVDEVMTSDQLLLAVWGGVTQRFERSSRFPYPGCGERWRRMSKTPSIS